ncbi:MAG: tyrosine-type recombinase/integrase [Peptococcales bacterium]|jgi:integrase
MAYIRKNKKAKTWTAEIYVGRDPNGKIIREYITKDSEKECKMAAKERELEIESMTSSTNIRKIKVTDWIDEWIEMNRERLSPSTVKSYKTYLNAHYKPFFGNLKMDKVAGNEILLRRYMALKLKTLSPTTVKKHMTVLNKIFREALRDKNPIRFIELPQPEPYTPYVLSDTEFEKIHNTVKGTIDEPFVLLAAWCGLRLGEICALRPDDIFKDKGVIKVDENLAINDEYEWEFKEPKSKNGIREIAIPEYLMNVLIRLQVKRGKIAERLFNYLPSGYTHRWARIVREKNLPPVRFHDLRHYHASWLYAQGIPDQYAAKRLGHDIQTLKGIYQHLGLDKEKVLDDNIRHLLEKKDKNKIDSNKEDVR